jgi:transposase InsO family protein
MDDKNVAEPARVGSSCSTSHDPAVASIWFSGLLALEISRSAMQAQNRAGVARYHPADEQRESTVGAARIHGELLMLGFKVAESTVSKYMVRRRGPPSQTWRTFLRNHAEAIAAIDLCVVPTLTFERLFAFLVLGHGRRQLLWFAVTRNPTAEWLARQITEAFPWKMAPTYLVRDNDGAYGHPFRRRLRAMGIRDRPTSPRSPWQNPYAERLIGTLRRECLDHVLVFGERHLLRIQSLYSSYYNQTRTHLALGKDAPQRRAVQGSGAIVTTQILFGLHHRYARI